MRTLRRALVPLALCLAALACNGPTTFDALQGAGSSPTQGPTRAPTNTRVALPTEPPATPDPTIETTFNDEGRTLYLESEGVRVGVDTRWGSAIRELWFQGDNLINNYDGGRLLAVSLYDGDQLADRAYPADTGWNPTPSDKYDHANPPLETSFADDTLYLKVRYLQWFPDNKGGGPSGPVSTELIVETWIRFYTDPQIIQLRYRLTNEGDQGHAVHAQEFPFAYLRTPYHTYMTYAGDSPWTHDAILTRDVPLGDESADLTIASERWAGLVNDDGVGLVMWAPQAYPNFSYKHFNVSGPAEFDSLYLRPQAFLTIGPRETIETMAFLFVGRAPQARSSIYRLRQSLNSNDIMAPFGFVDGPSSGEELSGTAEVGGWAIDDRGVDRVEVYVDGELVGEADLGYPRPDLQSDYPGLPGGPEHGYRYPLDTSELGPGDHVLQAVAVDDAGNESVLRPGEIAFSVPQRSVNLTTNRVQHESPIPGKHIDSAKLGLRLSVPSGAASSARDR